MTLKESRNAGRKQQTAHNVVPITSVLESLRQENTKLHILGDLPGHVRAGAVDLRRILPGERPTAVTAHAAVGVADDFSAGDAGVGEAATGYKSAGWVYQHTEIFIQAVRFRDLTHDPLTQITHVFGIDVLLMLCADQKGVDALFPVVIGDLGFRVRQQSRVIPVLQPGDCLGRQYERQRQHLRGFVRRVPEHHALVAGTFFVHAKRDVRGLLRNLYGQVEVPVDLGLRREQDGRDQVFDVRLMLAGDLARDRNVVVLDQGFHSHTAVTVVPQAVRDDRVRDLIADFVRVSVGHLFRSKQHPDPLLCSEIGKAPTGARSVKAFIVCFDSIILSNVKCVHK